jgi:hypothetical protein
MCNLELVVSARYRLRGAAAGCHCWVLFPGPMMVYLLGALASGLSLRSYQLQGFRHLAV